jgi:hypothetical protein
MDKKIEYNQNGIVNLRKLTESLPSNEAGNLKEIKEERNAYKQKYFSLQVLNPFYFSKKEKICLCK